MTTLFAALKWFGVWSLFWAIIVGSWYWKTRGKGYDR